MCNYFDAFLPQICSMRNEHDGKILQQIIEKQGITKTALADKLNVDRGTIHRMCNRDYLTNEQLIKIGKVLRLDMSAYYTRLQEDAAAGEIHVFNEDPAQYIKRVNELERKVDVFNDKSYSWMEEAINSYKALVEEQRERILILKTQLENCKQQLNQQAG